MREHSDWLRVFFFIIFFFVFGPNSSITLGLPLVPFYIIQLYICMQDINVIITLA